MPPYTPTTPTLHLSSSKVPLPMKNDAPCPFLTRSQCVGPFLAPQNESWCLGRGPPPRQNTEGNCSESTLSSEVVIAWRERGTASEELACQVAVPSVSRAASTVCYEPFQRGTGFQMARLGTSNVLSGAWVFCPRREKGGIVGWNTGTSPP